MGVEKHPYVPLFFTKRAIWDGPDGGVLEKPDMLRELFFYISQLMRDTKI